jgi:hypothetical protein
MSNTLRRASIVWVLGATTFGWMASCADNGNGGNGATPDSGAAPDSTSPGLTPDGGRDADGAAASGDGGSSGEAGAGDGAGANYVLIDDMETTTNGPILLPGINPPLTPGYWFNFGASVAGDTANPALTVFAFSTLPSPTTTLNGKVSAHAAHQVCTLNGQYDVCGLGFEFAQVPDLDAGIGDAGDGGDAGRVDAAADAGRVDATAVDAAAGDGGDAGPSIPRVTVPFDISQYKGIVFWAKTTTADAGTLDLKVQFPDTDTDPRGGVCNSGAAFASGPSDTSQCYNSYSVHRALTGDWQEFTVLFSELGIESFGFQFPAPWNGKQVYGVNWQGQKNDAPDAGVLTVDFWIDDAYFTR